MTYLYKQNLKLSKRLLSLYPKENNYRFFSLGQSPSWIIKACEILTKQSSSESSPRFGYIAFSGGFVNNVSPSAKCPVATFLCDPKSLPSVEQMNVYRQYLQSIGMDVDDIISLWMEKQIKTVIVEITSMGDGLASFLAILCLWAKELGKLQLMRDALDVVNISTYNVYVEIIEPNTDTSFSMKLIDLNWRKYKAISYFLNEFDDNQKRLVAFYPKELWGVNEPSLQSSFDLEHRLTRPRFSIRYENELKKLIQTKEIGAVGKAFKAESHKLKLS